MIYITGDTHGNIDFEKLDRYFSNRYVTTKDYLIILGDVGIVWSEKDCFIYEYTRLGLTVLFIDGNHENFELLNKFPIVEYRGAKCHYIANNIYHIMRGEIITINKKTFFCMGGATSIDKEMRTNRVSWWTEESITNDDINRALTNLKKVGFKVDYVLSHCAPSSVVKKMFGYETDCNTDILEKFKEQIEFNKWFFGHYHENKRYGKYRCFYGEILEIPILDEGKKAIKLKILYSRDDGYMYNPKTGRKTSIKVDDLPEWYFNGYRGSYFSLKDVTDTAFRRSYSDNHLDKDAAVYIHYHGKLKKKDNYEPLNGDLWNVWDYSTWRESSKDVCLGIEKYSPHLSLEKLKSAINLNYDQYNNRREFVEYDFDDCFVVRPFPKVYTPHYVDSFDRGEAHYMVCRGDDILTEFIELDGAIKYAEKYISKYFKIDLLRSLIGTEETDFIRAYDTGHNIFNWIYIKQIKYEQ